MRLPWLFKLYSDNNMLTKSRALDLKQDFMSSIKIMFRDPNRRFMSSLELRLDNNGSIPVSTK